ncbi:hypothetical protein DSO57_1016015 [Entomophthora muscae]|uniref:Uncharacterized protein n=1 Tax=Entomophthora muscae TaxID=34485 RepID=A0ACC2TFX6_9FUNG|nr:hypothetical protein DSO57_1016015 [Entomophthora muscae]
MDHTIELASRMQDFIARYKACEDILPPLELARVAEYACSGVLSKDELKLFLPPGVCSTSPSNEVTCVLELASTLLVQAKILHQRAIQNEESAKEAEEELFKSNEELRRSNERCQQLITSGREAKDKCWDLELHIQTLNSQIDSLLTANLSLSKENSAAASRLSFATEAINQLKYREQELMESLEASMKKNELETDNLKKSILKMHEDLNNIDSGYLSPHRSSISSDDASSAVHKPLNKHLQESNRHSTPHTTYKVCTYEKKRDFRRHTHNWELGHRGALCARTLDLGDRLVIQEILKGSPESIQSGDPSSSQESIGMNGTPGALALPPSPISHSSNLQQFSHQTSHTISSSPPMTPPPSQKNTQFHDNVANAIQTTMAGEFLYKCNRSLMRQERRSLRFFWVNPQAKYLYWCTVDPGTQRTLCMANKAKHPARSAFIRSVRLVNDPWSPINDYPDCKFLPALSIIIDTPTHSIKLKARTEDSHKLWESGLFYLQSTIPTLLCPDAKANDENASPVTGIHRGHLLPAPIKSKRLSMFSPRSTW